MESSAAPASPNGNFHKFRVSIQGAKQFLDCPLGPARDL